MQKIAYLHKTHTGLVLTVCDRPCNGAEFASSTKIAVGGKREARAVAASLYATPHNF